MNDTNPPRWSDLARMSALAVFGATFAAPVVFWLGVQLSTIESAVASVQSDVSEIKSSVREHAALPAHPVSAERMRQLSAQLARARAKK